MENPSGMMKLNEEEKMGLPPGFRFHPTDEELITHYLSKKAVDGGFCSTAITEVDLNKSEPWELPWKAKMGEKEWYFFCVRDRKYPTGLRTNRATKAGYWKATGKDKPILRSKALVGMKKTLVFYEGRAPRGQKTSWVMHEFRLEGKFSFHGVPPAIQNEWVICRVFQKSSSGKKVQLAGMMKVESESQSSVVVEPITDMIIEAPVSESMQFLTSAIDGAREEGGLSYSLSSMACLQGQVNNPSEISEGWQLHGWLQEQTYMKDISQENGCSSVEICNGEAPSLCVDYDCLWNY